MADAIGKTGSIAKQAGVPLEELAGYVTSIVSATGISGSEAGTALKSIISRTFRIGEEGMDDPGKVEETLSKVKIYIRDANKEFRPFGDILQEVTQKWNEWDKVTKQTIADSMAGTYHISKFTAMMDNFSIATNATTKAINSQNSAMNEQAKYAESIEGKLGTLKATMEEVYKGLLHTDFFKGFISTMTTVVNAFGSFEGVITLVSLALGLFAGRAITQAITSLFAYITTFGTAQVATLGLKTAFQALSTAFLKNPIGLVVVALSALAGSLIYASAQQRQHNKETLEALNLSQQNHDNIVSLVEQYKILTSQVELDANEKQQLVTVESQLKDALGESSSAIDFQNGKIDDNIEKIKQLTSAQLQSQLILKQVDYDKAKGFLAQKNKVFDYDLALAGKTPEERLPILEKRMANYNTQGDGIFNNWKRESLQSDINNLKTDIEANQKIISEFETLKLYADNPKLAYVQDDPWLKVTKLPKGNISTTGIINPSGDKSGTGNTNSSLGSQLDSDSKLEKQHYLQINTLIERQTNLINANKALQENVTIEEKNKLLAEQITLEESLQKLIHQKAEDLRTERDNIKSQLIAQNMGLNFEGEGDNALISNAEWAINSLTESHNNTKNAKEKEYFKTQIDNIMKFGEIQGKSIPSEQGNFVSSGKSIFAARSDIQSNEDKAFEDRMNSYGSSIKPLETDLTNLEATMESLGENDLDKKLKTTSEIMAKQSEITNALEWDIFNLASETADGDKQTEVYKNTQQRLNDMLAESRKSFAKNKDSLKDYHKEQLKLVDEFEKDVQDVIKNGVKLKKDALDDELKDFKDFIDDKIKAKDEEYAAEDYKTEINREFKDRQKNQDKLNGMMYDTSLAGEKKRKELKENIEKQDEKIADMQTKRRRDLEKNALQDSMNDKERATEKAKRDIDDEWNEEKINMEARNALINKSFANIASQFPEMFKKLNVGTSTFFETFAKYKQTFTEQTAGMAKDFKDNVLPQLQSALNYANQLNGVASGSAKTYDFTKTPEQNVASGINLAKPAVSNKSTNLDLLDILENASTNPFGNKTSTTPTNSKTSTPTIKNNPNYGIISGTTKIWTDKEIKDAASAGLFFKPIVKDSGGIFPSGRTAINLSGKDEMVFNPQMTNAFMNIVNDLPSMSNIFNKLINTSVQNIPSMVGGNSVSLTVNIAGDADSSTVSALKSESNNIMNNIKKLLNKNGVYR